MFIHVPFILSLIQCSMYEDDIDTVYSVIHLCYVVLKIGGIPTNGLTSLE